MDTASIALDSPYPRCPAAAEFFAARLRDFAAAHPIVAALDGRLRDAGVDLFTLVDHWTLPADAHLAADLRAWGFVEEAVEGGGAAWAHPHARLPRVRLDLATREPHLALAVEEVDDFLERSGLVAARRDGDPDSAYETAEIAPPDGALSVVARRGYRGFVPGQRDAAGREALAAVRESFRTRPRAGDEAGVVREAGRRFAETAARVGRGRAVDEFFAAEREYYLARNAAARWQYARQQALGIGWANHDHHTYRSSRENFRALMQLWQQMGFSFRERFYAGAEAGWGAQILEHPESRVILFCDVDMSPDELDVDFLEEALAPRDTALGTIGLWCALHGSSIAEAGMHHIECEFDFARCEAGFKAAGFGVMKPFTDLPILKQAFTEPEAWPVAPERLADLQARGAITPAQADAFARSGAAGSHLEILQRWEGFKGFNKTGVSAIIRDTDARRAAGAV
jgi:hypothetical protein